MSLAPIMIIALASLVNSGVQYEREHYGRAALLGTVGLYFLIVLLGYTK